MTGPSRPGSLTTRLLISQVAVSVAMALTMIVVAVIAGPPLFDAHMREAGHDSPDVLAPNVVARTMSGPSASSPSTRWAGGFWSVGPRLT